MTTTLHLASGSTLDLIANELEGTFEAAIEDMTAGLHRAELLRDVKDALVWCGQFETYGSFPFSEQIPDHLVPLFRAAAEHIKGHSELLALAGEFELIEE